MAKNRQTKQYQRGSADAAFFTLVLVLVCLGLIMVFSASYANAYYLKGNSLHFISKQFSFAAVGVVLMVIISKADYMWLRPLALPVYLVTLALLGIVLKMPPINNVRRWIVAGPINFQPSEIAKFSVVLLFAAMITANEGKKMGTLRHGVAPFVAAIIPVAALMLMEPHLSGTVLILGIGMVMMFVGGTKLRWFALGAVPAGFGLSAVIVNPSLLDVIARYADKRITVWLNPFSDPLHSGFQTVQSLYAIGSGGLLGAGIGASRQKYLYLPEPHNDFIFAIACEELGFIGAVLIILLFVLLVFRGLVIAARCPDRFGSMLAAGITCQVGLQAMLNIAVVTNTIPNTGISLPFFSYGGTSLLMLLCEMGVVVSVSRVREYDEAGEVAS
jgi:cell division protein FtsW